MGLHRTNPLVTGRARRQLGAAVAVALLAATALHRFSVTGLGAANRVSPSHADVVVLTLEPPTDPPGSPVGVAVTVGPRSLVVSWQPPLDDGGAPITAYEASAQPGGSSCTTPAWSTTCTIGDLNNGQFFTVVVRALNRSGPGAPSSPTDPVQPRPQRGA